MRGKVLVVMFFFSFNSQCYSQQIEDDTIAINKAFLSGSKKTGDNGGICPKEFRHWFLGYIEGRTKTAPPETWSKMFLDSEIEEQSGVGFVVSFRNIGAVKWPYGSSRKIKCPTDVRIEKRKDSIVVKRGENMALLKFSEIEKGLNGFTDALNIFFTKDTAIVAFHGDRASGYEVYCIEPKSGKLHWKTFVGVVRGQVSYTGMGYHVTWIEESEDGMVTIFGFGDDVAYLQKIDPKTGKNLLRFSTGAIID